MTPTHMVTIDVAAVRAELAAVEDRAVSLRHVLAFVASVEAAAAPAGTETEPSPPVDSCIRLVAETLQAGGRWWAKDLAGRLLQNGWSTESTDPVQTTRTALQRLVKAGAARPVARGLFEWTPIDEEEPLVRFDGSLGGDPLEDLAS